jgi:hypothetical protein
MRLGSPLTRRFELANPCMSKLSDRIAVAAKDASADCSLAHRRILSGTKHPNSTKLPSRIIERKVVLAAERIWVYSRCPIPPGDMSYPNVVPVGASPRRTPAGWPQRRCWRHGHEPRRYTSAARPSAKPQLARAIALGANRCRVGRYRVVLRSRLRRPGEASWIRGPGAGVTHSGPQWGRGLADVRYLPRTPLVCRLWLKRTRAH